jgi:phosphohistidine phosphatase
VKTLLLLRHAKSDWSHADLADHDRPLNKRGKRDAPRMGQLLRDRELVPDLILTSSAVRARKTASAAARAAGYNGEVQVVDELYEGAPESYIGVLQHVPKKHRIVMVVGHNPGLELLLQKLTGASAALPTAALAKLDLAIDNWSQLDRTTHGELAGMWRPRELT